MLSYLAVIDGDKGFPLNAAAEQKLEP